MSCSQVLWMDSSLLVWVVISVATVYSATFTLLTSLQGEGIHLVMNQQEDSRLLISVDVRPMYRPVWEECPAHVCDVPLLIRCHR